MQEENFVVTTESGHMVGFDTRQLDKPIFSIKAHDKACSQASFSPHISNMLATVGADNLCKIWDINNINAQSGDIKPKCIMARDLKQGELFSV